MKVVAADSDVVGGKKAVGVLIDEAWLFGKNPKAADMIREATGGLLSRPEGFIIWLTTQSNEPPAGVFRSKLNYARGVRDGRIDDNRFLPIIYEFSQEMIKSGEARKPENFHLVNPNIDYLLTGRRWSVCTCRPRSTARRRCAASWPSTSTSRSALL